MKSRAKELGIARARINSAGCLDRCENGPTIVVYPEGIWYTVTNEAEVDAVLTRHLVAHGRATELMME